MCIELTTGGSRTASLKNCFIDKAERLDKETGERHDNGQLYSFCNTSFDITIFTLFITNKKYNFMYYSIEI